MAKRRRTRWITNATSTGGENGGQPGAGTARDGRDGSRTAIGRSTRGPACFGRDETRRGGARAACQAPGRRLGASRADCSASMIRSKRDADAHLSARKFVATERDILACLPSAYDDEVCASPGPRTHATRPTRAPKTQCALSGGALSAKVSRVWGDRPLASRQID